MLIYMLGTKNAESGKLRRHIILLGKYSLFGYLAQIAVLQFIFRGLQHIDLGASELAISLIGAVALTVLAVEAVDRARARSTTLDGLYVAVFA
jgi:hypothetical protein